MPTIPELILPQQFSVTVTPPEYQYTEQKFYAGNISRVSLTKARKTATMTIEIRPLRYSYFVTLKEFFDTVRQHENFKVDRVALIAKNKTIPYLVPEDRYFFFKEPIKLNEEEIGINGILKSITLVLQESYALVPVPPVIVPSPRSVGFVTKLSAVGLKYN